MLHEVNFKYWCPRCEHWKLEECEDPCHDCLGEPANEDSRKPVMFKDGRIDKQKEKDKDGKTSKVSYSYSETTVVGLEEPVSIKKRKLTVTGKPIY